LALKFAVGALALLLCAAPAVQARAASSGGSTTLTVRLDSPGAAIDRNVFGQFAEMLGEGIYGGVWVGPNSKIPNVRGIRTDVVEALRALKVPNVRWPGGCYADQYHWRDGVGPDRRVRLNALWGGVLEPNTFGTHEFMDFVDQIGSEAYISVNVGSGTVQEAADWFEYMTADKPTSLAQERAANGHKEPYRVKYLGLGNESWGCGGAFSPDAYVERMKLYSQFVQNYHPEQQSGLGRPPGPQAMKRIAVGQKLGETAYTEAVMKAWKERAQTRFWEIDGLSLHYYTKSGVYQMSDPSIGFGEKEYATLLKESYRVGDMITEHSAIMDRYDPDKRIALVIDEWGAWLRPLPGKPIMFLRQQNSLRDAILAAVHLNIFARHADRVRMTNIAQMVNVIQAMILTDNERMLLTPTYYVYRMYVPFQDAQFLPVEVAAGEYTFGDVTLPRVDAIAARAQDGTIWLAITNLDPNNAAAVRIQVRGVTATSAVGETLTAPKVDSVNTFDAPKNLMPQPYQVEARNGVLDLKLAAKSVTVVRLK